MFPVSVYCTMSSAVYVVPLAHVPRLTSFILPKLTVAIVYQIVAIKSPLALREKDIPVDANTTSSKASNVGWYNHYTSDYQCYKVLMKGLYKGGSGSVYFRFYSSGTSQLTGAYTGHFNDSGNASDDNYYSPQSSRTPNSDYMYIHDGLSTSQYYLSYIEFTIWDPLSSVYPRANFRSDIWDGSSWTEQGIGTIGYRGNNNTTAGGFIYCSSGNTIYYNDIIVYGLRT